MTSYKTARLVGIISVISFGFIISLFSAQTAHAYAVSIQSLSPGNTVVLGQTLTFTALASSDFGATPTYLIFDDKTGSSLTSSAINATSSAFSWTPITGDLGRHTLSVEAIDGKGAVAIFNLLITVATSTDATTTTAPATVTTNNTAANSPIPLGSPVASTVAAASSAVTQPTNTSGGLTSLQNVAIAALLRSYGVSEALINQTLALLSGSSATPSAASSGSVSSSSGTYTFTSLLKEGSSGTEVSELQKRLSTLGYFSGTASGYFGPQTTSAVKAFQTARGIAPLGYVGPSTRTALNGQ